MIRARPCTIPRNVDGTGFSPAEVPAAAPSRRGSLVVLAMLCLIVFSLISVTISQTVILQRRQLLRYHHEQQAIWLADSGLNRAAHRWQADAAWTSEVWRPDVPDLSVAPVVQLSRTAGPSDTIQFTAVVDWPSSTSSTSPPIRVQRQRLQRAPRQPAPISNQESVP
jgi:Tfp pilus assembly protein PilX